MGNVAVNDMCIASVVTIPNWSWNGVNTVLALAALYLALRSTHYGKKQVQLQQEQKDEDTRLKKEDDEWCRRFTEAADLVCRVGSRFFMGSANLPGGDGFSILFPDPQTRLQIESLIIERDGHHFRIRQLSGDVLRMPLTRQLIEAILNRCEQFKKEDPETAKRLTLL